MVSYFKSALDGRPAANVYKCNLSQIGCFIQLRSHTARVVPVPCCSPDIGFTEDMHGSEVHVDTNNSVARNGIAAFVLTRLSR